MIGRQLAHYTITAHLGSGGMGDVYQATDTRLDRNVALKFLPEAFSHDDTSAARFQREAKTLAALNHPRIAAVHGLEKIDGRSFIVMEFVPGRTLAERISGRPVPLEEALRIARQIAEALEAAHDRGIVHRDLKPANIKIKPDGEVKILDFGLAKPAVGATEKFWAESPENAPTIGVTATHQGTIVGTPAYMAPEQVKGSPAGPRVDIFAFGCVLYEMLAGRRAFDGANAAEVLSRVLQREPDWTQLPSTVPPAMRRLLRLCLEKDPQTRRQSAGDVRVDLDHAETEQPATVPLENSVRYSRRARMMWLAGLVLLLGPLAIPAVLHLRKPPAPELRLQIVTPPTLDPLDFALSPDGQQIVFVASGGGSDSGQRLYLRALNDVNPQPLDGTDGARFPFWSPDGRSLGFFASGSLFRIDVSGGPAQRLAPAANPLGGAWGADGTILFAPNFVSPLFQVPATGGKSVPATQFDSSDQNNHRLPSFLPDGRGFLFYVPGESDASGIFLGSLDGTPAKRLTAANSAGEYLAPDHIVYLQDGALVARKFVTAKGEWAGDPITLAKPKGENDAISGFSVSATGTVAYRTGSSAPALLTWFDHIGKVMERSLLINAPELSPNGNLVAFDRTIKGNRDVWVLDLVRGGLSPLTFHPKVDGFPVWSPEGTRIAFETNREGNFDIWVKQASGAVDTEQRLHGTPDNEWPLDWSSDGRFLLFCKTDEYYVSSDLYALPMTGDNPKPVAVANTPFEERRAKFSPDGKWVAYDTDQSGRSEVVVQAFPASTGTVLVSTAGGSTPRWSADGKEIYFIGSDERMMAVSVAVENSTIKLGKPAALFSTQISNLIFKHQYVVTRDGRFGVLNRQAQESSPITVILNWKP